MLGSNFSAEVGTISPTTCYTSVPSNVTRSRSKSIAFSSTLSQDDIDECMSIITRGLNREYIKSETGNELLSKSSVKVAAHENTGRANLQSALPEKEFNLDISPNPNDGNFVLTVDAKEVLPFAVEIFSSSGVLVSKKEYSNVHQVSISHSGLPKGIYLVKVTMGVNMSVKRIVIN